MARLEVDSILFDMDGTLIDERESYREAIRLTAEYLLRQPVAMAEVEEIKQRPGFNNDWDATWGLVGRRLHGATVPPSAADRGSYAFRRLRNVFQTYYLGDRLWREMAGDAGEPPFQWPEPLMARERPLVSLAVLEGLRQFVLGIATSRPRAEALMALRQHRLDRHFEVEAVVAAGDALREKPDGAPLRELVRRLGVRHPVYVGDSIDDALAAGEAGMPFIHIGTGRFDEARAEGAVVARVTGVGAIVDICVWLQPVGAEPPGRNGPER